MIFDVQHGYQFRFKMHENELSFVILVLSFEKKNVIIYELYEN